MLTESTTLFVFVDELDRLLHQIVCLSYHRFELRNSGELFDVNDIIDYVGHADDELDYFLVTRVIDIQDLLEYQSALMSNISIKSTPSLHLSISQWRS